MAAASAEHDDVDKLYEFSDRLNEAKDKSKNEEDYRGIIEAAKGSQKAKQLAAQLIPKFCKNFPTLAAEALTAHIDLCEEEELGIRVQAIRNLPLFGKDAPENVPKVVDILVQLLVVEENLERDAVQKSLMSMLRQDVKASLNALFKTLELSDENLREKVLHFVREKVFPIKAELLKPQQEMERHITDLVKKCLTDVTGGEFIMFMDFLKSLSIFGPKAPTERVQELVEIIEGQADLDAQFNVSDTDHVDRLMSCLCMALPFYMRGASNSKFLIYLNKFVLPAFDKLVEERKQDLLKNLAEASPYTSPQDSRQLLPSVVQLLKKYMPGRKIVEETSFNFVECLLYAFHNLARKTPNTTNSLCGYKIVTGQPSDRLGEDFTELNKDFTERLSNMEDLSRTAIKKLTQAMAEHTKAMATAKTDEEKTAIKLKKQSAALGMKTCNNILSLAQPLHSKTPTFGEKKITLSWKEAVTSQPSPAAAGGGLAAATKRTASAATNGSGSTGPGKKGRIDGGGRGSGQLVSAALSGISRGGRGGGYWRSRRGRGRGRGGDYL